MGSRRVKMKNPRRTSTEDERTLATIIRMMRSQKKKVLSLAATPLWKRMGMRKFLLVCLLFRWLSAFVITTEFVPDESWQSTEVAYVYTWGRGHLTWEWLVGLRNHLFPFAFTALFKTLKWMGADTPYALLIIPRLAMATLTALGDWSLFLYCTSRYGISSAKWSLTFMLTCWFTFYCGPRTLTNSVEMSLNCIAMYLMQMNHIVPMVGVVALNFVIRPTAVVIWIPQIWEVWKLFIPMRVAHRLPAAVFIGLGVIVVGGIVDSLVYGKATLTWLRFIQFNFIQGDSAQFGEHHVLWYFYSGVPSILGLSIVPLLVSLTLRIHEKEWTTILGFISCFSLIRHKEIRFLLPVLPHMFALIGDVFYKCGELGRRDPEVVKKDKIDIGRMLNNWFFLTLAVNILAALYFCSFHQGGILPIANYVNMQSASIAAPHIWVMMQCYSVPVFTYLHNPSATYEYFTCAPSSLNPSVTSRLYNHEFPFSTNETFLESFISTKLLPNGTLPHLILTFDTISSKLISLLGSVVINGAALEPYEVCFSYVHAHFGDQQGLAQVLCAKGVKDWVAPPSEADANL